MAIPMVPADKRCDVCGERAYIYGVGIKLCKQHQDELWEWKLALERQMTAEQGGPWPQTCPRRLSDLGPWERGENLDEWHITLDYKDRVLRTCSFCGSLHPDDFMERMKNGETVGPTDKNYKAYLGGSGGPKFYYQHLSIEQRREFVECLNDKRMVLGDPGHFYRLPFFCVPSPPPDLHAVPDQQ